MPDTTLFKRIRKCQRRRDELIKWMGYSTSEILGSSRKKSVFQKRQIIACMLRHEDFSISVIGLAMDRDHTTILNMVCPNFRKRKLNQSTAYHKKDREHA